MDHFAGLDVSVKETSICIVDDAGKIVREVKVASEPEALLAVLKNPAYHFKRIGLEAGPLSQWLFSALAEAGLPVICVETRHMQAVLKAQINKTDRNDARGIAQMMRAGLYRPVHVKTIRSQKLRMLLTHRKLLQSKAIAIENDLRGTLRNFGLKVGMVGKVKSLTRSKQTGDDDNEPIARAQARRKPQGANAMSTRGQNDFLTQTGPGTPVGNLLRRYWIPALLSAEVPEPDCAPVRVKVLSERLLAFRDTQGRVGVIDEFCAHRGVSLWFGRNEENGLRCAYHGWKYDVSGQCTEVPSEPEASGFCKKIKLTSYPCVELGDVIWIYMGPAEHKPPLPAFEWAKVPHSHRFVSKRTQECNYLQAMEGGIDSAHVSFLHRHELRSDSLHVGKGAELTRETDARFEVVETRGGMVIGVRRPAEAGHLYWRITQWIMPFHSMIPPYGDNALNGHAWVPIDDENCMSWCFTHHPTRPLSEHELHTMRNGGGIHVKLIPGSFRPVVNKDNDYMIDRAAQASHKSYCGVAGIAMQDAAIQESMGPIQDRSKENLVSTDNGVIMARIRLRKAALAAAQGKEPDGIDPATHAVRSASIVLPEDVGFYEAAADALEAKEGVTHTSV